MDDSFKEKDISLYFLSEGKIELFLQRKINNNEFEENKLLYIGTI